MRPTSVAALVIVFGTAAPSAAQQLDARWTPWLGCWQLGGEEVRVCVTPSADARGVTLSTYVDGGDRGSDPLTSERESDPRQSDPRQTAVLEQTLVADGARHAIAEAECRGYQSADW